MIDPLPFQAVSSLFHEAMARRPPRLPRELEALLESVLLQHESFRAVLLDDPPVERLREAAAVQFHLLAALCERQGRPPGKAVRTSLSASLLYREMIRRLMVLSEKDRGFGARSARDYLETLAVTFGRLIESIQERIAASAPSGAVERCCAEYLCYVALTLYSLLHVPATA